MSNRSEQQEVVEEGVLIQPERYFDGHNYRNNFAVRSSGWPESPGAHGLDGFLAQAHPGILDYGDVDGPPIRSHCYLQHNRAHVFRLPRVVRVKRRRAIDAFRNTNSVHAGAERSATGASTFSRSQATAGSTADACAIAMTKRLTYSIR